MKKRTFSITAAVAILFTACSGGKTTEPKPIDVPPPVEQKNETLKIFYTEYNTLYYNMIDAAIAQYNTKFPDKPVQAEKCIVESSEDLNDAYQRMLTQFLAGDGPDLVYVNAMNMEKMARSGAFADMEPYFQEDNYDWSDFNQAVMDGGVWEGKRLAIPLSYDLPILYTSEKALAETGFDVENCGNYQGFLNEVEKVVGNSGERAVFRLPLHFRTVYQFSGIPYVDFDAGTVDLSAPELKQGFELYKTLQGDKALTMDTDTYEGAAEVRDGTALWLKPLYPMDGYIQTAGAIKTFDKPVMLPIRDINGGIQAKIKNAVAVRNNSENLQNAYNFIKILLSEELGKATVMWRWEDFSVRNSTNYAYYQSDVTDRRNPHINPNEPIWGFTEIDPPTPEEFERLMGYAQEVTGAYFSIPNLSYYMLDYLNDETTYDKALKEAQKQLEIYLSE